MGLTSVDQLLFFADELEKLSSSPEETLLPKVKGLRSPRLAMPRPASVGVKARPQNAFSGNWVRPMTTNKVASVYAEAFERMTEAEKLSNIAPAVTAGKGAANVIGNIFKKVKSVATKTPTVTPTAPGVTQLGRTTRAQPLPSQTPTQAVQTPPREVNPPMRVEAKPQRTPAEDVKWAKNRAERQRQIETTNPGKQVSFSSTGAPRVSAPAPRDKYFQGLERSGRTYRGADARPLSGRGASLTSRADEILDANLTDEWISQHPKRARALRKRKESLLISEGVSPEEAVRRSTREPLTNEDWIERTWNPKPKQETQGQRASRLYESGATQVAPSPVRGPSKAPTPEATPAARPLTGSGGKPGQTPVAPDAPIPTPYESGVTQVAPTQFLQERLKRGARRPGATAAEAYESGVTQVAPSPVRGPSKAPTPEATPADRPLTRRGGGPPPRPQVREPGPTLVAPDAPPVNPTIVPAARPTPTPDPRPPVGQTLVAPDAPPVGQTLVAPDAPPVGQTLVAPDAPPVNPTIVPDAPMLTQGQKAQQLYESGVTQAARRPGATAAEAYESGVTQAARRPGGGGLVGYESGATQVVPRTKPGTPPRTDVPVDTTQAMTAADMEGVRARSRARRGTPEGPPAATPSAPDVTPTPGPTPEAPPATTTPTPDVPADTAAMPRAETPTPSKGEGGVKIEGRRLGDPKRTGVGDKPSNVTDAPTAAPDSPTAAPDSPPTPQFDPHSIVSEGGVLAKDHGLGSMFGSQRRSLGSNEGVAAFHEAATGGKTQAEALGAAAAAHAGRPLTKGQKVISGLAMLPLAGVASAPMAGAMGLQALSDYGQPKMGSLTGVSLRSYRR